MDKMYYVGVLHPNGNTEVYVNEDDAIDGEGYSPIKSFELALEMVIGQPFGFEICKDDDGMPVTEDRLAVVFNEEMMVIWKEKATTS
jgi:hypothetical protein